MGDYAEGTTSQAGVSQIVDPTQYQHQYEMYQPQYEQTHQKEGGAHERSRPDHRSFPGDLLSCRFYRILVDMWHAGYGTMFK